MPWEASPAEAWQTSAVSHSPPIRGQVMDFACQPQEKDSVLYVQEQPGLHAGDRHCRLLQSWPQMSLITNSLSLSRQSNLSLQLQAISAITQDWEGQQTRSCTSRLSMPSPQVSSVSSSRLLRLRGALLLAGASVPHADTPTSSPETDRLPAAPWVPFCFCPAPQT